MNRWLKWLLRGVCLLIFPVLFTGVASYFDTHLNLDYCKSFISYQDGFAGIEENGMVSHIFCTDRDGALTSNIQTIGIDLGAQRIKSCDQLITDENNTLYVVCTLYNHKGSSTKVVYRADFTWDRLVPVWKVSEEEMEGSFQSGQIFSITDGVLYFTLYQEKTNHLVTYSMKQSGEMQQVNAVTRQGCDPERCLYTPEGLVTSYRDQGVFLQEEKLYPLEETSQILLNALSYENGILSFLDFGQRQSVRISLSNDAITSKPITGQFDLTNLQSVSPRSDGSFTASYEQEDSLIGVYWNGRTLKNFFYLQGNIQWGEVILYFLLVLLVELLLCGIVWLIWFRKRNSREQEKRRFVSVRTRISVISLLVTVIGTIAITWVSASSIERYSRQREQINSANAAQSLLSVVQVQGQLEEDEKGNLRFSSEFVQKLNTWISHQNANGLPYSYELFLYYNEQWYCLYSSDLTSSVLAEYAVGVKAQEGFQQAVETKFVQCFEDRRSIGILYYTMNAIDFEWNSQSCPLVAASFSNGYEQQAIILSSVLQLLKVVIITCLLLLLAENILIWLFMHRLRLLNRALQRSAEKGEWEIADFPGRDEVSETAQTMKTMTGSIQVYMEDIQTCNAQYERLIPKDVITLMGASSFTQVQAGQMAQRKVFLFTLALLPQKETAGSKLIETALKCMRAQKCMILHFDDNKVSGCFMRQEQAVLAMQTIFDHPVLRHQVTLFLSPATVQVGVVGNDSVKRVLILSEEGEQIRSLMENLTRQRCLGFFLHMDGAEVESGLSGYSFRLAGWLDETAYYECIPVGEDSPKFCSREKFEQALLEYREGNYQSAAEKLQAICQENSEDTIAATYWLACCKRLGGEQP